MKNGRWIFWLLAIAFIWLVISRFNELQKLLQTLAEGQWQWIMLAALLQFIYYVNYSAVYWAGLDTVEVKSRVTHLVPIMFASVFVNVAAPSGGASGSALFVEDARRHGQSPGRAAAGTVLVLLADYGSLLLPLIVGMGYLLHVRNLKSYEIAGAAFLLLIIGGLVIVLTLGILRPDALKSLLFWLQARVNGLGRRFKRRGPISEDWAERTSAEFIDAALAISTHPDRLGRTFLIALLGHLVSLTSLWVVFLAFRQPVNFGILVAGYAMGMLFWIVSITPQGIGVVEAAMALVFVTLNVPPEHATIVALAWRGLTFWIPFLVGFILLRRLRMFNPQARPSSDIWSLHLISLLTAAMGVFNVISAILPTMPARVAWLAQISPLEIRRGSRLTAALAGFALILLASGLRRRKGMAWFLTIVVLVVSAISQLLKGLDYTEALLALGLAFWLFIQRAHFHARSDPPSVRQGLIAFLAATLFTLAYGALGFYLLDRQFKIQFGLIDALRQTIVMFTQFYNPGLTPVTGLGRFFAGSIYFIGASTYAYALFMLIRPVLVRHTSHAEETIRARRIIESYGCSSLAAYALFADKSYCFSSGGSVIQYMVKGRVALALGDPIGPAEDLPAALHEFCQTCSRNDWVPAFYQAQPDFLTLYQEAGLQQLTIGHEGLVDLDRFNLEKSDFKNIRGSFHRLVHLGYQARMLNPPVGSEDIDDLRQVSDRWLTMTKRTEKRFSVGWFDEDYIRQARVLAVYDATGSMMAFATVLSEYQRSEWAVDLIRQRPEAENGTLEFLFVSLFQWAHSQGVQSFNLGLSALSGVGENPHDPMIEKTLHYIFEHINRFYYFKGLHHFKEKFHPRWSPRYLIYPDLASLPLVTIALIRADSGEALVGSYLKR